MNDNPENGSCFYDCTSGYLDDSEENSEGSQGGVLECSRYSELKYLQYISQKEVTKGLACKELLKGTLRISATNYNIAFVSIKEFYRDVLIEGVADRNGAFQDDHVIISLRAESEWKPCGEERQKTGQVVYIQQQVHPRVYAGELSQAASAAPHCILFMPRDRRNPRLLVPLNKIPESYPLRYDSLHVAKLRNWNSPHCLPYGELLECLGPSGNIHVETKAVLFDLNIEVTGDPMKAELICPNITEQLAYRQDYRHKCVITIDPPGAKDLDDALSCEELPSGNLRISVHIADVSFYLKEDSALDREVAKRTTSVYLPHKVYEMLPTELSSRCSFLPGEDKLAVSVIWEFTADGDIITQDVVPSVINSCGKLSYEEVQEILKSSTDESNKSLSICSEHGDNDIRLVVKRLGEIADILYHKRVQNGCVSILKTKIKMLLNPDTCLPFGYETQDFLESNRLVQEYMVLANATVGRILTDRSCHLALIRSHTPPKKYLFDVINVRLSKVDMEMDLTSSSSLSRSIEKYRTEDSDIWVAMNYLCASAMVRAQYICSDMYSKDEWHHYGLGLPVYTHFTSPIRRYADVVVHRLLKATLGIHPMTECDSSYIARIADNCNHKKWAAKLAESRITSLYFGIYLRVVEKLREPSIVLDVNENYFVLLTIRLGFKFSINVEDIDGFVTYQKKTSTLSVVWKNVEGGSATQELVIKMFVTVAVDLMVLNDKIEAVLAKPDTD